MGSPEVSGQATATARSPSPVASAPARSRSTAAPSIHWLRSAVTGSPATDARTAVTGSRRCCRWQRPPDDSLALHPGNQLARLVRIHVTVFRQERHGCFDLSLRQPRTSEWFAFGAEGDHFSSLFRKFDGSCSAPGDRKHEPPVRRRILGDAVPTCDDNEFVVGRYP